jgi:hypothetical protein
MVWPLVAAAGIAAVGALHSGAQSQAATKASELRQLEAQSYYTHNQHQIEIEDLRKAGLNPILAARYGGNQATGGGSGLTYQNIVGPAVSSGLAAFRQGLEYKQAMAQIKNIEANTQKAEADTQVADAAYTTERRRADLVYEQSNLFNRQARLNEIQQLLESYKLPGASNEAYIEKASGPALRGAGKAMPYLKLLQDWLKGGK